MKTTSHSLRPCARCGEPTAWLYLGAPLCPRCAQREEQERRDALNRHLAREVNALGERP